MTFPSEFDLIIVGAGINGAGIARDAALRGLRVLLVDKADIGSGTSSWSTRLIHGGLRYLEHGELGLVRESLREREILLKIAPHLVKPLPILIPIYKSGRRGKMTIRAGMMAYDVLSVDKKLPRYRMLSSAEAVREAPTLNPDGLTGAAVFYDAQVEFAERLVLENVLAARDAGASLITYAAVGGFRVNKTEVTAIEFVDSRTGETQSVRGRFVVNAAGPWIDELLAFIQPETQQLIGGTKGSHIVVRSFPGAPSSAIYVEAQSDKRPFFIIPWNGNVLIGTTDIRFEGDLDQVKSEPWEIDYLLAEANRVLPMAQLSRGQVVYTYSGVRPLPFTETKDEQTITRRHFIREHPQFRNLVSIVGGKLTTYRSLAEECVSLIFKRLGQRSPRCTTDEIALPGANNFEAAAESFLKSSRLSDKVNQRLLRVYGARTHEIMLLISGNNELSETFNDARDAIAAEVIFSFEKESATTLSDCLLRRTMLGLNADLAIGDDERAATIARKFLGWSEERAVGEVMHYREGLARFKCSQRSE